MKKNLVVLIYLFLVFSPLLIYIQVRNFECICYDDNKYVSLNQYVQSGLNQKSIHWAFTTNLASNWHPLTWLSLMLDCQLFGFNPGRIHLVNLFLHIANTALLFAVFKKITGSLWPSAFVAAAFALHPMHVESVAWIAERKDVLSTLFWMLTMLAYARYVDRPTVFRYLVMFLLFALGLLAKPMLVTLPFVLLLADYWPLDRWSACRPPKNTGSKARHTVLVLTPRQVLFRIILEKLPLFALAAISSGITYLVQHRGGAVASIHAVSFQSRIENAFLSYARYIGKLVWPQNLSVFYPFDINTFTAPQIGLCILMVFVLSFCALYFGRKFKYLPAGWLWFIGTLVPVIGLVQTGEQSYADRYTYIPYIGLFIIIAWGIPDILSKWRYHKIAIGTGMLIVLSAWGIITYRQTGFWKNSTVLFTHAINATQNNAVAHFNLGNDLYDRGNAAQAAIHLTKASEMGNVGAQVNLALMYAEGNGVSQDFKEAVKWWTCAAIKGNAEAQNNLGVMYASGQGVSQDFKEAARWWTEAAKRNNPDAQYNLGLMYADGQGVPKNDKEAIQLFIRSAEQGYTDAQSHLALMYASGRGITQDYIQAYRWLLILAAQKDNNPNIVNLKKSLEKVMTTEQINEAQRLAGKFLPAAIQ